ncbi:MAG: calcium:proton antiporter [Hyphomicrobium sp.]
MQYWISQSRWDERLRSEAPFVVGGATLCLFLVYGNAWLADPTQLVERGILFVWLLATIAVCIFGVVRHADALAEQLGEPLGTLILTVSVIVIEVSLIAAVMLEGATDPTLARDTMFSVIMIMMNGMVGLCLLSGGLLHVQQEYNLEGARAYLAVLVPLSAIALILPRSTASTAIEGSLNYWQATLFSIAALVLYAIFLALQTMRHRGFFELPENGDNGDATASEPQAGAHSVSRHALLLLLTMLPIVGLSEYLAVMVEQGIHTLQVPTALGGTLIALLILAPESITALRAALANRLQRSIKPVPRLGPFDRGADGADGAHDRPRHPPEHHARSRRREHHHARLDADGEHVDVLGRPHERPARGRASVAVLQLHSAHLQPVRDLPGSCRRKAIFTRRS